MVSARRIRAVHFGFERLGFEERMRRESGGVKNERIFQSWPSNILLNDPNELFGHHVGTATYTPPSTRLDSFHVDSSANVAHVASVFFVLTLYKHPWSIKLGSTTIKPDFHFRKKQHVKTEADAKNNGFRYVSTVSKSCSIFTLSLLYTVPLYIFKLVTSFPFSLSLRQTSA